MVETSRGLSGPEKIFFPDLAGQGEGKGKGREERVVGFK